LYHLILVPTDGSKTAKDAATHAVNLALKFDGKIIAVYIIDSRFETTFKEMETQSHVFKLQQRKIGEGYVQEVLDIARKAGVQALSIVREGIPADEIVKIAEENNVDLIVMGTRGLTGARRALLGSTADQVIRWAPCPVMVVK
jgi:nucleotide-binding universal stress UspA family protein